MKEKTKTKIEFMEDLCPKLLKKEPENITTQLNWVLETGPAGKFFLYGKYEGKDVVCASKKGGIKLSHGVDEAIFQLGTLSDTFEVIKLK